MPMVGRHRRLLERTLDMARQLFRIVLDPALLRVDLAMLEAGDGLERAVVAQPVRAWCQ
jgi:hypothetical protein